MALLPDLARLRVAPNAPPKVWPVLQCENVFILPGCLFVDFFLTRCVLFM